MRIYIGITDSNWYSFLAKRNPDEVNFWRPGTAREFHAIAPGAPFLFKLHSPKNFIAGGGFLVRHTSLPLSLAWQAFVEKNGAASFEELHSMISAHRKDKAIDPIIGCSILSQPFFWPREQWIPAPSDWSPNLVQGRTYSTEDAMGAQLWREVESRLSGIPSDEISYVAEDGPRWGESITKIRIGQGGFRVLVTDAYKRRCAITGEKTLPVLEAAHIQPYSKDGPHATNNGLLLRSDLHTLFDLGYVTVTKDYRVEVSRRIKEEYENGREYYKLHGSKLLVLPQSDAEKPSEKYIEWHNTNVFAA
jgi:putative restriction endonuclease